MIHDSRWGFGFSWRNSLLSWVSSWQYGKIKIIGIMSGSLTYETYLNTLNTELCWLYSLFLYWFFHIVQVEPTHLRKLYSWISEKHDQTSINLTNVFDFVD